MLALLLVALSLAWSAVGISRGTELSRYDEWTYIDYARKVAAGHVPVPGESLASESLEDWSCRGMTGTIREVAVPSCQQARQALASADGADPQRWPLAGENYNAFHPPLYFLAAGHGGKLVAAVSGSDFVTGARWISALFVAGGVAAVFLAIRAWRASRTAAFGAALLVLATPAVAAAATIVHNDAITPMAGAAAVWLGARIFVQRRFGWVVPAAAMALFASMRVMSTAGLLTVLVVAAVAAATPRLAGKAGLTGKDRRPLLVMVAAGGAALLTTQAAWSLWQAARTPDGYVPAILGLSTRRASWGRTWDIVASLGDAYGLTDPATDWYMQPALRSDLTFYWSQALYWFYLVVPLLALALLWRTASSRTLAVTSLAGPAVVGGAVQFRELVTAGRYFRSVSGRYAMSVVPLVACAAALVCDRRPWMRWSLLAFATVGYLAVFSGPFLAV